MPRKPLRQEEVPAGPVDVGDGGVPQSVEWVEAVESSLPLPGPEGELYAALADADSGLGAEEGVAGLQSFPTFRLVCPEFPELTHQHVRQENIARPATLGDFGPDSEAGPRGPIIYLDIPYGQAYNFGQTEPSPESKRVDEVIPEIAGRCSKNRPLFAVGQGRR